jgi:hypothetical protein
LSYQNATNGYNRALTLDTLASHDKCIPPAILADNTVLKEHLQYSVQHVGCWRPFKQKATAIVRQLQATAQM